MKKLVAPIMAAVMVASMVVPVMAEEYTYSVSSKGLSDFTVTEEYTVPQAKSSTKISFSDISAKDWYYKPIMNMVSKGLIAGTVAADANGVGQFAPTAPMTRGQFVTIVTRYLYPDELAQQRKGDYWWSGNYKVAVNNGLIKATEFSDAAMAQPMSRQEMAMVLVRAMDALGEDTSDKISKNRIPDYNNVGTYYKDYVRVAYKAGLIAGMDDAGTFAPKETMNRAQAATVLNRLVDASTRIKVSGDVSYDVNDNSGATQTGQQTVVANGTVYKEGSNHSTPKAGDTVIKADGTKVVIQPGYGGVLGAGQGVDIWSGAYGFVTEGDTADDGSYFVKCDTTGEMHSTTQWNHLMGTTDPNGKIKGDYDGEIYQSYWKWTANETAPGTGYKGYWKWIGANF